MKTQSSEFDGGNILPYDQCTKEEQFIRNCVIYGGSIMIGEHPIPIDIFITYIRKLVKNDIDQLISNNKYFDINDL